MEGNKQTETKVRFSSVEDCFSFIKSEEVLTLGIQKEYRDKVIKVINAILAEDSEFFKHVTQNEQSFKGAFECLKEALVREIKFLCISNNHAERIVNALTALNDPKQKNKFFENLDTFNKIAENSQFYPRLRLAMTLLSDLAVVSVIFNIIPALLIISNLAAPGSAVITLLVIACLASTATYLYKTLPDRFKELNKKYAPVYNVRDAARLLNQFFKPEDRVVTSKDSILEMQDSNLNAGTEPRP